MNIATYPKYDTYQKIESDWVEELPSHWGFRPVRANFAFRNEKNDPVITEEILSLSIAHGVTRYSEEGRGGNKRKDDLTAYKIARPNDIVLNSMNVIVGAVGRSKFFGAISPVYYALFATNPDANIEYFDRVFSNSAFQKGLLRHGKGILMKLSGTGQLNTIRMKISQNDLKTVLLPSPPPNEQEAIVAFLDRKCTKIDEAVRIKEEQIKLLRERRQILIQQAVTRGLKPSAPMKDSGIDWIGQIPAHWEVKRNKHMFLEINERSARGEEQHLSMSQKLGLVPANLVEKSLASESYQGAKLVKKGDLVLNRLKAHLAVFSLAPMEGLVSPDYSVFRPFIKGVASDYFEILFKTSKYLGEFRLRVRGIVEGFYRLYTDDFMDCPLLLPPLDEQLEIVRHVRETSENLQAAISIKEDQITALKEYKTSLINAAVTGKIKVI